ncbi:hypothetical protein GQ55_3G343000 [Panicum hallii var. hallii]|uniref:Uncharacterized protein n=1 Tax=Panicum hallii var. hallii TaxID=1504633 RepID=A0A2T7EFP2_9POAL|nr:hypothetical protein GQ55_3G343000 [Panicum hallii var. hallii]
MMRFQCRAPGTVFGAGVATCRLGASPTAAPHKQASPAASALQTTRPRATSTPTALLATTPSTWATASCWFWTARCAPLLPHHLQGLAADAGLERRAAPPPRAGRAAANAGLLGGSAARAGPAACWEGRPPAGRSDG